MELSEPAYSITNALDDVSQDFINIASAEITINWSVIYFYNGSSYGRDAYTP